MREKKLKQNERESEKKQRKLKLKKNILLKLTKNLYVCIYKMRVKAKIGE